MLMPFGFLFLAKHHKRSGFPDVPSARPDIFCCSGRSGISVLPAHFSACSPNLGLPEAGGSWRRTGYVHRKAAAPQNPGRSSRPPRKWGDRYTDALRCRTWGNNRDDQSTGGLQEESYFPTPNGSPRSHGSWLRLPVPAMARKQAVLLLQGHQVKTVLMTGSHLFEVECTAV